MQNDGIKSLLESFLLDPDLELLEKKLSRFNLFDILNLTHKEVVHSSAIRWMLDPIESHGLGDYMLKKILKRIAIVNKDHPHLSMPPIEIDLLDLTDSIVQTEERLLGGRRGDITILDERNKIYILIENKIWSSEEKGQTKAYVAEISKMYPLHKNFLVYLSPEGEYPEAEEFLRFSYQDLAEVLKDTLEVKEDDLSHSSKFLIEQFIRNIEDNILEEGEIQKLCQEIYRKHRKAIERIIRDRPQNKQIYSDLGELVINKLGEDWNYRARNSFCSVYRERWRTKLNPDHHMPGIHYEFYGVGDNKITIAIHLEDLGGKDYRNSLREELRKTDIAHAQRGITWKRGLFVKTVIRNVDKTADAVAKGAKEMQRLIKNTAKYLDEAIDTL